MSIFGSGNYSVPKAAVNPPQPKTTEAVASENAATAERLRLMRAQGKQSTMLTSGSDLGTATTSKKSLLGG